MGVFSGDTICVSGAFSISQNEMKELVIKNGAHIATTPNKSCTYLVADSIGSSKTMKAEKDGIPIVTEEWVQKSIKVGKKSTDASLFLSSGPTSGGSGGRRTKVVAKSRPVKKKSKSGEAEEEEEEEEDEEEEVKPKKKKSTTTTASSKKKGSKKSSAYDADIVRRMDGSDSDLDDWDDIVVPAHYHTSFYMSGMTDKNAAGWSEKEVLVQGSIVFDSQLDWIDKKTGNKDSKKRFRRQVLQSRGKTLKQYYLWINGGPGKTNMIEYSSDMNGAIKQFKSEYRTKTGNVWGEPFENKPGKFVLCFC